MRRFCFCVPYTISNPPARIENLPKGAQEIWINAYNSAYDSTCKDRDDREACANKIAYAAVKNKYEQDEDGEWHLKESRMTLLDQFTIAFGDAFKRVFGATVPNESEPEPTQRTVAMMPLLDVISELLADFNRQATVVDPQTGAPAYMDWDEYFMPLDVYYDDDGSLFLLVSRRGQLFRLPVIVVTDPTGETRVGLADPVQIPLSRSQNSVRVFRTASGEARWFGIASSSVLNRVNEIDSTSLYDNFIKRAQDSGKYPILSFYHKKTNIQLGVADWLARDGFLYLAAGTFDETPDAQAALTSLERSAAAWGMSIGYYPLGTPELVEVAPDVKIPVFTDGFNDEISIVLEHDAASHFTHVGTEEVTRSMKKNEFDALVLMFGEARAQELAAQIDGTNRTIEQDGLIARTNEQDTPQPPAQEQNPAPTQARQVELDDDLIQQIAAAVTQSPAWQEFQTNIANLNETIAEVVPVLNANTTNLEAIQATVETRLNALERTDADKQREWQADLPQPQVRYSYRPREQRVPQPVEGEAPSMELAAQQTLARMKTRQPQAQQ